MQPGERAILGFFFGSMVLGFASAIFESARRTHSSLQSSTGIGSRSLQQGRDPVQGGAGAPRTIYTSRLKEMNDWCLLKLKELGSEIHEQAAQACTHGTGSHRPGL
jgi:hypothetical protein